MNRQRFRAHASISIYVVTIWIALSIQVAYTEDLAASQNVKRGEQLFIQSCAFCHDAHSRNGIVGPGLKGYYANKNRSAKDEAVRSVILHGRGSMPGFSQFSPSEVDDLIRYLRTL